jgi:cytochrome P450
MFRTAVRDTEVNGHPIAEGERVALLYPAANRDPAAFDEPHRFDVARPSSLHLAFGHGTHFCLGANLARAEVRLLLEELTARTTRLRPVTEPDVEPNVFARAVRRFDLAFDVR